MEGEDVHAAREVGQEEMVDKDLSNYLPRLTTSPPRRSLLEALCRVGCISRGATTFGWRSVEGTTTPAVASRWAVVALLHFSNPNYPQ